ncbi:uncharacterized protein FMAN_01900 [Fusarium mangiferae]|uniref:Uncharacterized protein n=1 Tax=Fusarium mangiferae TaxID=192010 RepID=A0A1L7SQ04_FUSMA|nr:uncharacterized protein FMAN_01900 [Fusarium mangiferae]CVK84978.1 uncharacterized protein FMAN_01900 [Fusarium mangiferae]
MMLSSVLDLLLMHHHSLRSAGSRPLWAPLPWDSQVCAFQTSLSALCAWITTIASNAAKGTSITRFRHARLSFPHIDDTGWCKNHFLEWYETQARRKRFKGIFSEEIKRPELVFTYTGPTVCDALRLLGLNAAKMFVEKHEV